MTKLIVNDVISIETSDRYFVLSKDGSMAFELNEVEYKDVITENVLSEKVLLSKLAFPSKKIKHRRYVTKNELGDLLDQECMERYLRDIPSMDIYSGTGQNKQSYFAYFVKAPIVGSYSYVGKRGQKLYIFDGKRFCRALTQEEQYRKLKRTTKKLSAMLDNYGFIPKSKPKWKPIEDTITNEPDIKTSMELLDEVKDATKEAWILVESTTDSGIRIKEKIAEMIANREISVEHETSSALPELFSKVMSSLKHGDMNTLWVLNDEVKETLHNTFSQYTTGTLPERLEQTLAFCAIRYYDVWH